ncbi:hypothetical protein OG618_37330 (plasmid) [Kitasatospora sp. NBC_01246]|uniref:hypothetical protein n=1 Tax=Kitasatospora sp. NBC_01246 TaxID=2903570 RepID=UPI002E325828|nr:hypothetical protein [Kitasatospora sp. NBC_01246]
MSTTTITAPAKPCPIHPDKDRYATAEAAAAATTSRAILLGYRRQRPYYCQSCDWFHISTHPPRTVASPTHPDGRPLDHDEIVRWFTTRTPDVQRHLVLKDLEELLAPELAAALRTPAAAAYWLHVLKPLVAVQAAAANGPAAGRREARARLALLRARRLEARALVESARPTSDPGKPAPTTVRDYAAAALARRRASEAQAEAVTLLINRHPDEWGHVLDHARRERGLPPVGESESAA